ncbi:M12 family metallopeptidase [Pedobacter psychroterrae]|uniref:Matrixin family metalloprotease n=1 Tax=Pedobacter psychroterrae TaxID=2530453 RepID=A0A4R0NFI6_9SPHI|nr:M12 family metallopeptidase [Pedobacter psychroterrae]TCC98918.1 matrixin family metalloprotease [Pedobacter psychroterrae]
MKFFAQSLLVILGIISPAYAQITTCVDVPVVRNNTAGVMNGVSDYSTKWTNGTVLNIMFTGGTEKVRAKVMQYAKIWEQYANIKFNYISQGQPDMIISFREGEGSYSHVGVGCRTVAKTGKNTMNFGWFNDNTEEKNFKRTTLHEFGHALGLLHEHKNPLGEIKWNKAVIYGYYQQQGWSVQKVDEEVLNRYSVTMSNHQYDPKSVMHYPIPANHTLDGYSVDWNTDVSEGDIKLISEMYPKQPIVKPNGNTGAIASTSSSIFKDITMQHNVVLNGKKGMKIFASFAIDNAQNKKCLISAYYYDNNGAALNDLNNSFRTTTGKVSVGKSFSPSYPKATYTDFELFMPYDELHAPDGDSKLSYKLSIWDEDRKELANSGSYTFDYSKGISVTDFSVSTDFVLKPGMFSVIPKFVVKNAYLVPLKVSIWFYDENKKPLKVDNALVANHLNITPAYFNTVYNGNSRNFVMQVPYTALNLKKGSNTINYFISMYQGEKKVYQTSWLSTEMIQP